VIVLSEQEEHEIAELLGHSEQPRAAIPDALKIVQAHRGWVSDEAVVDVAAALGMSADEVDGVATFYNLIYRKPVGKHVILVCDSVSCWIVGYENIREHLVSRLGVELGQTTADGMFTLLPVCCLGACDLAPVMMIDDELYGKLTAEKIDEILARYRGGTSMSHEEANRRISNEEL
jgi:NADH-quinone oxidoreductase subunit E